MQSGPNRVLWLAPAGVQVKAVAVHYDFAVRVFLPYRLITVNRLGTEPNFFCLQFPVGLKQLSMRRMLCSKSPEAPILKFWKWKHCLKVSWSVTY